MGYLSISCGVFELGLSPAELMVYCAVSCAKNQLSYAICSTAAISRKTGLSTRTIHRAIDGLKAAGILSVRRRYRHDGSRAANGYDVMQPRGRKFRLDLAVWGAGLDAASFAVYLLLAMKMNNRTREAYPSLGKMSDALHMSRHTVISAVRRLEAAHLVKKTGQRRKNGARACNRHLLFDPAARPQICFGAKKKERMPVRSFPSRQLPCSNHSNYHTGTASICSLARLRAFFKRATAIMGKVYSLFTEGSANLA